MEKKIFINNGCMCCIKLNKMINLPLGVKDFGLVEVNAAFYTPIYGACTLANLTIIHNFISAN